jgi:hypothetical protein
MNATLQSLLVGLFAGLLLLTASSGLAHTERAFARGADRLTVSARPARPAPARPPFRQGRRVVATEDNEQPGKLRLLATPVVARRVPGFEPFSDPRSGTLLPADRGPPRPPLAQRPHVLVI